MRPPYSQRGTLMSAHRRTGSWSRDLSESGFQLQPREPTLLDTIRNLARPGLDPRARGYMSVPTTAAAGPQADETQQPLVASSPSPKAPSASHIPWAQALPMAAGYTLCSSCLMVTNKVALVHFPFPSTLMACQFFTAALVVRVLAACGQLEAEPLEWPKVKQFAVVPLVFSLAIFSNIKVLQAASVETTIVFRSLVPLITSWADWQFMQRELPSSRSLGGLLVIVSAALSYALTSRGGIRVDTWLWALFYLVILSFEMVYVKHVLNHVPMATWTRVYYNNAIALCMCPPFLAVGSEYAIA